MLDLLKSPFVGVHELRKDLPRILEQIKDEGVDVVITKQGKPVAVLLDVEKYEEMYETLRDFSDPEYVQKLWEAQQEIREGKGVTLDEVLKDKAL